MPQPLASRLPRWLDLYLRHCRYFRFVRPFSAACPLPLIPLIILLACLLLLLPPRAGQAQADTRWRSQLRSLALPRTKFIAAKNNAATHLVWVCFACERCCSSCHRVPYLSIT